MSIAKELASATALDEGGTRVSIGSLWARGKAVIVMIRYFDSASCRKLVAAMREATAELESRGARLAVIAAGPREAMAEFRDAVGYRGPLLVDPTLEAFRLAGMAPGPVPNAAAGAAPEPSGFLGKVRSAMNADVGTLLRMNVKEALTTDLVKLGQRPRASGGPAGTATTHHSGVFVLGPGATTAFAWRARAAGELPGLSGLLAALPRP